MTSRFSIREPLKTWRQQFQAAEKGELGFWEGERAFKELKERDLLFVTLTPRMTDTSWQEKEAISRICTEVLKYRENVGKVVAIRKELEEARELLQRFRDSLTDRADHSSLKQLGAVLRPITEDINEAVEQLDRLDEKRWETPGVWGNVIRHQAKSSRRATPRQELDLDSYFQLRIARIMRVFLHPEDLTRSTIARLIVLTYISTGLAEEIQEQDGRLMTLAQLNTNKKRTSHRKAIELKPIDVDQNLRRAKLK